MPLKSHQIRALAAKGFSIEQIADIDEAMFAPDPEKLALKREQTRIRVQNHRSRNASNAVTSVTPIPPKERSPTPPKEITPLTPVSHSETKVSSFERRAWFEKFWIVYPHKVGKRDAEGAFEKALGRTDFDTLMAGLDAYVHKTDDRPWCNPGTWLRQDRWNDRPQQVQRNNDRRGVADVYLDKLRNGDFENGSESLFGHVGDVELLPPISRSEPGLADEDFRRRIGWDADRRDH